MQFPTTKLEDFSILTNGIDSSIEIIRHDVTGFYNITKIALLYTKNKAAEANNLPQNEPDGIPSGTRGDARFWFQNASTAELRRLCEEEEELETARYELAKGTPKRFAGTYVHRYLYDNFLGWLDKRYAIKIAKILDNIHMDANRKKLQEKDNVIESLSKKIDEEREEAAKFREESRIAKEEQNSKINELLKFGNKIIGQNDKLQLTLDMTRDELSESLDYLVDKAFHSTIDPSDNRKITHFAVLAPNNQYHEGKTIFVRGQTKRIRNVINKNRETHTPAIDMTYNANAVNLILNAQEKYELALDEYIEDFNKKVKQHNSTLAKEISKYNRDVRHAIKKGGSARPLRNFKQEKRPPLTHKEMKLYIKFNTISLWYKTNPHFSYDQLIAIIKSMNTDTQKSPMVSSENETDGVSDDDEESKSD